MTSVPTDYDSARAALTRLIPLAMGDTGQARRVANFLMAWWNGPELGHFEIADMFGLDIDVANDITSVIGFLGQNDRGASLYRRSRFRRRDAGCHCPVAAIGKRSPDLTRIA